jgi:DNA/RNA endonuclease G (NUC1)
VALLLTSLLRHGSCLHALHRGISLLAILFVISCSSWAKQGIEFQMPTGNPDGAMNNATYRTKYLIQKRQYSLSYNDDTHEPNWVSWSYTSEDTGSQSRTDAWATEELLPSGYLKISTATFGTGWDRGHMCPSADRTTDYTDNAMTFRMSNIIPQTSNNNQGLWANFETYTRGLATGGNEVLIITGPGAFSGKTISNGMWIPGVVWKIAVVVPSASNSTPANQRLTTSARVIAIMTPNITTAEGLSSDWKTYITSIEEIEQVTGFSFLTAVNTSVATYLKNVVDTGTGSNQPTVISSVSPLYGSSGTTVAISGYNFGTAPVVEFNGVPATGTVSSGTITATVPPGASTGPITVVGTGGTDTSYEPFTVTSGSLPSLAVSASSLTGFSATEGSASSSKFYTVTGSNLTGDINITAPTDFEISSNNSFFGSTLTLTPVAGALTGVPIYIRIKASALLGSVLGIVTHSGGGVTTQNLSVSGAVLSSLPSLTLSTPSLSGFFALPGSASTSKSYTISGSNLTSEIIITAPTGYEISLNNITFAATQTLTPIGGTIASTTIYARLSSTALVGSNTGSISHAGGSATTQSVEVSGTVTTSSGVPTKLVSWEVSSLNTYGPSPFAATTADAMVAAGGLKRGGGVTTTGTAAAGTWGGTGFDGAATLADAIARDDHISFTVTPAAPLSFTQFPAHNLRRSSTGPSTAQWQYCIGSGPFVSLGSTISLSGTTSSGNSQPAIDLSTVSDLQVVPSGTIVTFRLVLYGATSSGGTFYINNISGDDLALNGTFATTGPATPVITVSGPSTATAFQSFTYQIQANNSPTSYGATGLPVGLSINTSTGLISGAPTTPGSYNVGLAASNAGGDGTGTLTLTVQPNPNSPVIGGALTATGQVGVAFDYQTVASNTPNAYMANNLPLGLTLNPTTGKITGTPTEPGTKAVSITVYNDVGSDTKTITITILAPSLQLNPSELVGFLSDFASPGISQSYLLTGTDLASDVTIVAPANFEISGSSSGPFVSSLVLTPVNGSLLSTLYVRLSALAEPGNVTGSVIHFGGGAIPKYLAVSGKVTSPNPLLTLSVASLSGFSTTEGKASDRQVYTLNGVGLTSAITVTAPTGFEISLNEEVYNSDLVLTPSSGNLANISIYIRLSGTAVASAYTGQVSHSGGAAVTQNVVVAGTVTPSIGPPITSILSSSVYTAGTFSYTITAGGLEPITRYEVDGLPAGLTFSPTTAVISGTSPATAGVYSFTISASTALGASRATFTLRVVSSAEQAAVPLSVVINKYQNTTTDRIELLVVGDNSDSASGPKVNLQGMILKDFNSNMATDGGGKYSFTNHALWASVKAGTLIVLSGGNTSVEDLDPSDFVLRVNLGNPDYFTIASSNFDIGTTDMLMIKPAWAGLGGVAGGIHVMAAGTAGTQYTEFTGKKIRSFSAMTTSKTYAYVINDSAVLSDYYLTSGGANVDRTFTFGTGNNTKNTAYVSSLRALDQDGPILTLVGSNPMNIPLGSAFIDPGATATDISGGSRTVTPSGTVNTAFAGTYVRTYTSADSVGNITTATRTVVVEKGTPVINSLPLASSLTEGQPLLASMLRDGSATYGGEAVLGSFAWAVPSAQPPLNSSSQFVTFTPSDVSNYQVVTFSINVTVNSAQTPMQIWAAGFGLSPANAEPGADPDGDGLNNAGEYAFGTSPVDASSRPVTQSSVTGGIKITYLQRSGVTYAVKSATDLAVGFTGSVISSKSIPQPTGLPSGYEQYEATLTIGTKGFLKVEATVP